MSASKRILLSLAAALMPLAAVGEAQSYTKSRAGYRKSPIAVNVGSRYSGYTRRSRPRSFFRKTRSRSCQPSGAMKVAACASISGVKATGRSCFGNSTPMPWSRRITWQ